MTNDGGGKEQGLTRQGRSMDGVSSPLLLYASVAPPLEGTPTPIPSVPPPLAQLGERKHGNRAFATLLSPWHESGNWTVSEGRYILYH